MPEMPRYAPGSFCWVEVATIDSARTRTFYRELFGWTFEDRPTGDGGVYSIGRLRGKDILGLYELTAAMREQGVPPHWMAYIAVDDTDATCRAVTDLGGKVVQAPFDVAEVGRLAVVADPTGAHFSLWGAQSHPGSGIQGEPGTPCWFELATKGLDRAEEFYTRLFGWKLKKSDAGGMAYHEFTNPGCTYPMGGMMELRPEHGPVPPHWTIYFMVNDVDQDAGRLARLGGTVLVPPMDIPKVGRFAVLRDPAGAVFSIFKLAAGAAHGTE